MGFTVDSANLQAPVALTWRPLEEIQPETVVTAFDKLSQSATAATLLGEPLELVISCLCDHLGGCPSGGGGSTNMRGLLANTSNDSLCLFRAAAMGLLQVTANSSHAKANALKLGAGNAAVGKKHLLPMLRKLHVKLSAEKFPLQFYAPQIEAYCNAEFPEHAPFRLIVVQSAQIRDRWLYPAPETVYETLPKSNICLFFEQNHYTTVWSANEFFGTRDICWECRQGVAQMATHPLSCGHKCLYCGFQQSVVPCPLDQTQRFCNDCTTMLPNGGKNRN
jgi:hypothetical protein